MIFRTVGEAPTVIRYDLDTIRDGSPDPSVFAGDVVVIDDSAAKQGLQAIFKLTPLASPMTLLF